MMGDEALPFEDKIAKLCFNHFNSLPKTGKPTEKEWTVLSCIILEKEGKFEMVALGTGSKCIGHDKLSEEGDILNDSHGEIICRRAFMRYIYDEILVSKNGNGIFCYCESKQKFCLDDGIKFHFFTTHVPCGDAAIFPKENTENYGILIEDSCSEPESKRIKFKEANSLSDIFRTGAKCLESDCRQDLKHSGADYHVTGVVRTKPGRGVRSLSVSCSDKLAKWCHLGIQGALLSMLLDKPIYLHSFIIAGDTPFNEEALERAFYGRLGEFYLVEPFTRHKMLVKQSTLAFIYSKDENKRPCPSSIIWLKTSSKKQIEVAVDGRRQGITKKQIQIGAGRLKLCKKELLSTFKQLVEQFNLSAIKDVNELSYFAIKNRAEPYQKSWQILKEHFKVWANKPENLLKFN